MTEEGIDEDLVKELRDSFAAAMRLQDDQDKPEVVYAVLESLIEYIGTDDLDFIEGALAECIVAASGGVAEIH